MSSRSRNAEKRREFETRMEREEEERNRFESLSLADQLEEAETFHDLKRILQKILERVES